MIKKYVIEGAPGSGKTTLLFGRSHDEGKRIKLPCLKDEEYNIISESMVEVNRELRKKGIEPKYNMDEVFKNIIPSSMKKYKENVAKGINLFDRGLPSYKPISRHFKAKIDIKEFNRLCKEIKYDSPIIMLNIIPSIDLSKPKDPSKITTRIYTLKERYNLHKKIKKAYENQGYKVIEIPEYDKNKKKNLKLRIKKIKEILS